MTKKIPTGNIGDLITDASKVMGGIALHTTNYIMESVGSEKKICPEYVTKLHKKYATLKWGEQEQQQELLHQLQHQL